MSKVDFITVDGLDVSYQRRGEGPPLVLLHGAVCDGRVWRVELERLSDDFTVVAWDAPGCGRSADAPGTFRMSDFADCLAAVLAALELEPAHVLGHSWGSTLALDLALRHPGSVRSVILVGGYAGWAGSLPPEEVRRRLAFALDAAGNTAAFDPVSMRGLFSDAMPPDRADELALIMGEIRPNGTRTMAYALAEADLRDALPLIERPTLIVAGDADERSPVAVAEDLHRRIAGSELVVLPGLGHECCLESPDAVHSVIRGFLRRIA